jgi:TRAP transporter 4TM/12TM fusion protein
MMSKNKEVEKQYEPVDPDSIEVDGTKYETLPLLAKVIFHALVVVSILAAVVFVFRIDIGGYVLLDITFYYLEISCMMTMVFFILQGRKGDLGMPWYDWLMAALAFSIGMYFLANAWEIRQIGWEYPEAFNFYLGAMMLLLLVECGRRAGGPAYVAILVVMFIYPLVADKLPSLFFGMSYSVDAVVGKNMFCNDGILGMPAGIAAETLIGFLLFGGTLISAGAGKFFLDVSLSLVGPYRGGSAKVAAISSGFYGSISGGSFGNIVATGSFTIPAMKKNGYPAHYAGAVEAMSSNGSCITPPIMGALSFVMAAFLGVDYSAVVIAAVIPAILYYFSIVMHVDVYAAKNDIRGLDRKLCPHFWKTMKKGWQFVVVALFLIYCLAVVQMGVRAAYYATFLMFVLSFTTKDEKMLPRNFSKAIVSVGQLMCRVCPIILGSTFILVALISTGMAASMTAAIINAAGSNYVVILLTGMFLCYLLGMIGLVMTPYIFLCVSMIPAVISLGGLDPMAVHMFVVFFMVFSAVTLPVAPAAFLAAALAGSSPMKTALTCMKLAGVVYFIPFFFVFNPALIMQGGNLWESFYLCVFCLLGIAFIAFGAEGYCFKIGKINWLQRVPFIVGGFLIALPVASLTIAGVVIVSLTIGVGHMLAHRRDLRYG